MRVLFFGDVIGQTGRRAFGRALPALRNRFDPEAVLVNGENVAGGLGATAKTLDALFEAGADVVTLGNHTWNKREFVEGIERFDRVARPANYEPGVPGRGAVLHKLPDGRTLGVVNLVGRVFMGPARCPFKVGAAEAAGLRERTRVVIIDMHAEATSEKIALGWHLDGLCTAVIGTHTHVQTSDERVLPGGTAYITDLGMTGPRDSVIGVEKENVIERFLTGMPCRFKVAAGDPVACGVFIDADESTGQARAIERFCEPVE